MGAFIGVTIMKKRFDLLNLPFGLSECPDQIYALSNVILDHLPYLASDDRLLSASLKEKMTHCVCVCHCVNFGFVADELASQLFLNNVAQSLIAACPAIKHNDQLMADIYNRVLNEFCGYICTNVCTDQDLADYVYDCYNESENKGCNFGSFAGVIIPDVTAFLLDLGDSVHGFEGSSALMCDFLQYRLKELINDAIESAE